MFVSLSFMLEKLFYKSLLTIQCTLENNIKATKLVNICDTGYGSINKKFMKIVCKKLEMQP